METLNKVVENLIHQNGTTSESDGEHCEECGTLIPPLKIFILGKERWVQPVCECYQKKMLQEREVFQNYQKKREVERLFSISDIGERYQEASFNEFVMRKGAENAFKAATHYAENFTAYKLQSLILYGVPGNGKTHLAASVHNHLQKQGKISIFVRMPDLLGKIRATFDKGKQESEEQILKALSICDLLIIDDLGAEKLTDWVEDILYRIIDGRYRMKKPVMATSNLDPELLDGKLGRRIYDRLEEMSQPIENKATSYRREKAKLRTTKFKKFLEE
ncbi:ATP-binding protein [Planococcus kocurii]|uniref:ATP-binding protein n=1 Tax=Planococcus kocurii TaxID=1374 RepID=UPI003D0523E2